MISVAEQLGKPGSDTYNLSFYNRGEKSIFAKCFYKK